MHVLVWVFLGSALVSIAILFSKYIIFQNYSVEVDQSKFRSDYVVPVGADSKQFIRDDAMGCAWDTTPSLIFSDTVSDTMPFLRLSRNAEPLVYYSHFFTGALGLIIGFFIFMANRRNLLHVLFGGLTAVSFVWYVLSLITWTSGDPSVVLFVWSLLAYIEPLLYILPIYFLYSFLRDKKPPSRLMLIFGALLTPIILFGPISEYNLPAFDYTDCARESQEGVLWQYIYWVEIMLTATLAFLIINYIRLAPDNKRKKEILLFGSGLLFFQISLLAGNIFGSISENWETAQYGNFGNFVFLGLISYLILRFDTFNVRVAGTKIFFATLSLFAISLVMVQNQTIGIILAFGVLIFVSVLGILFVTNARTMVRQQNELEILRGGTVQKDGSVEAHAKAIVENLSVGIIAYDNDFKILTINKSAERIVGVSGKDVIGRRIVPKDVEMQTLTPLVQVLYPALSKESTKKDIDYMVKDLPTTTQNDITISYPEERRLEVISMPIPSHASGTIQNFVKIIRDVTVEKKIDERKSEYITIVAHQLRTPLAGIKWALRSLLDNDMGDINEEQRAIVNRSYTASENLIHIVGDLLNVAAIEEESSGWVMTKASLMDVVSNVVESTSLRAKQKKIDVTIIHRGEKIAPISIDVPRIEIMLRNIIENAIDYTPEEGMVSIGVKNEKDHLIVSVTDTGIGISPNEQKKLFEKFHRGTKAYAMETDRSGLGLYLANEIAKKHGGFIVIHSKEGEGTTVEVWLPTKHSTSV